MAGNSNTTNKVCFDLDGVLCEETKPYRKAKPIWKGIHLLNDFKKRKYKIIIYTSRRERDKKLTKEWLKKYKIKYDKLIFNKPKANFYIDDKAFKFNN